MANVSFKRGTTAEIDATPNVDGQLLFDTTGNKILMDDGENRHQYGGDTVVDSTISTTSENPVQNKVITSEVNKKVNTDDIVDDLETAIATTESDIPIGCNVAKELNQSIVDVNTNLVAENNQPFVFGYDSTTQKYGHWVKEADTDVFRPFRSFNELAFTDSFYTRGILNFITNSQGLHIGGYQTPIVGEYIRIDTGHHTILKSGEYLVFRFTQFSSATSPIETKEYSINNYSVGDIIPINEGTSVTHYCLLVMAL